MQCRLLALRKTWKLSLSTDLKEQSIKMRCNKAAGCLGHLQHVRGRGNVQLLLCHQWQLFCLLSSPQSVPGAAVPFLHPSYTTDQLSKLAYPC